MLRTNVDTIKRMWYNNKEPPVWSVTGVEANNLTAKEENMHETAPEWLSAREAMVRLGIGRTRLWKLAKEGRLTAYQRGPNRKARYYARADVERLATEVRPAPSSHLRMDQG